jgi:hypothetical protein
MAACESGESAGHDLVGANRPDPHGPEDDPVGAGVSGQHEAFQNLVRKQGGSERQEQDPVRGHPHGSRIIRSGTGRQISGEE